jgi:phosphate-selective porin
LFWVGITLAPLSATATPSPLHAADAQTENVGQQPRESESAEEGDDQDDKPEETSDEGSPVEVHYKDGLRVKSTDGKFAARIRWRAQTRVTRLTSGDIAGEQDGVEEEAGFQVRRARFKLDGHAYRPWLRYFLEYGIVASVMLTLQFDVQPTDRVGVRIGQYKVLYNRERVDSSGQQQFVDRSVVNEPFTLDRQAGPTVLGRLFKGSWADSQYAGGVFTGTGRGGGLDEDRAPMFIGRWQWNFLGHDLGFSQSDIERRERPAASLAVAGATNVGRYTRFSSSGPGQLPGFEVGEVGQYELDQWVVEFAYQGRGLSIQSEYHFKRIDDRVNVEITELDGWYAQAGYFFHEAFGGFPRPLELAVRVARVDPIQGVPLPAERELTFGGNWLFNGHNNKITADASYLQTTLPLGSEDTGWRARLQWDISF